MSRQAAWASRAGVFPARPAPDLDIIKSPEAERMRQMVTEGFYDRSRIALWMFEVIGREYDDMAVWARTLRNEAFPQTCTWSIAIWEFVYGFEPDDRLTLEYRRWRILSRMFTSLPINPARIESALSDLTGCPVEITENVDPYTFLVRVDESNIYNSGLSKYDLSEALKLLRDIKQSHLSFRYETYAQAPHMPSFVSVNGSMPITVMTTEMLEPELPPLAANVGINSNAISVETTELPKVQEAPHRFETVLTLGLGSTNIASTRIPVQPEKPKRAVFRDENGQLEGAYLSGDGSTDPAYYNVESPERSEK